MTSEDLLALMSDVSGGLNNRAEELRRAAIAKRQQQILDSYPEQGNPALVASATYGFPQTRNTGPTFQDAAGGISRLMGPQSANYTPDQLARSRMGDGPGSVGEKIANSIARYRMSTDPMAARWRKMLANPAPEPQVAMADEGDAERKARLLREQQLKNAARYPGGESQIRMLENNRISSPEAKIARSRRNELAAKSRAKLVAKWADPNGMVARNKQAMDEAAARVATVAAAENGTKDPMGAALAATWNQMTPQQQMAMMAAKMGVDPSTLGGLAGPQQPKPGPTIPQMQEWFQDTATPSRPRIPSWDVGIVPQF